MKGFIEMFITINHCSLEFLAVLVLILVFVIDTIIHRKEKVYDAILWLGVTYISKPMIDINSLFLNWIQKQLNLPQAQSTLSDCIYCLIGVFLVWLGWYLKKQDRKTKIKLPLLNMLGMHFQAHVNQVGCSSELSDVEFDEIYVNFTKVFNKSGKITQSLNKNICEEIKDKCILLVGAASKSKRAYVTGMFPIPYEVFAGTFLNGSNVNDYLEYDSKNSKKFYALKNSCSNQQKRFDIQTLIKEISENLLETEDLNLIISVTSEITDKEVIQFQSFSNVKVELSEIKDNAITEKEQLTILKNKISSLMEDYGKMGYKRIHITAAIPTCLAVEIGKEIVQLGNRLPEIVVYHYVKTSENNYPFGLIVNGPKTGNLYHV